MGLSMRRPVVVGGPWGGCDGVLWGAVWATGSQAEHVRGMLGESWWTFGRSRAVMWCFGMRHFAPWQMTVVCAGLASFGARSRVSGGNGPVTGGTGSCFEPVGAWGGVAGMEWGCCFLNSR